MNKILILFLMSLWSLALGAETSTNTNEESLEQAVSPWEDSEAFRTPAESSDKSVEKIEVTGSRIKRINIEGPSPILVLDKEDIERSGYNSVADVLRDTNIAPFGIGRESAGNSTSGENFVSVHGASTLILINGQRVVEDPNAEAVDMNLIPVYAVERIEIIKDGSSALYGSDALGGVVNIIMKEDFSGVEVYGRAAPTLYPLYKGGSRYEGATVWGNTFAQGSSTGVLQVRFNEGIISSDREWSQERSSPIGPFPVFKGAGGVPPIVAPSCPKKVNNSCPFNYSEYLHTLPNILQVSGYLQADYRWNGVTFYGQILPSYKNTSYDYPPIPGAVQVKDGNKLSVGNGSAGVLVNRFMEAGNRTSTIQTITVDSSFGAKGYLSSTWDWDLSAKASGTLKKEKNEGLLVLNKITSLVYDGTYDPFTNDNRDLSAAEYTAMSNDHSLFFLGDIVFSGALGPVDLALGSQAFYNKYKEVADPNVKERNILSNVGSDGSGERTVASFYAEAAYTLFDMLELQLAGRGDRYSDFGFTANPKVAFRFQPVNSFLLRGSVGTSFIAPSLHSLYGSISEGFPTLIDSVACFNELKDKGDFDKITGELSQSEDVVKDFISDQKETVDKFEDNPDVQKELTQLGSVLKEREFCKGRQYLTKGGGNVNLKETKGISASVGSVLQWGDTSLTVDGWYIAVDGAPSSGVSSDAIKVELKKGSKFVEDQGVIVTRDQDHPYKPILNSKKDGKVGIDTSLLNIASAKLAGVDISLSTVFTQFDVFGGYFYFKDEGVVAVYSQAEGFPGRGFKDNIGKAGVPRWRNILTLGWKNNSHNFSFELNSVDSVTKAVNELQSVPQYHRLDLAYQWFATAQTSFNMGWVNALLSTPPRDDTIDTGSQIDESLHEVRGSYVYFGFKHLM